MIVYLFVAYMVISCFLCLLVKWAHPEDNWNVLTIVVMLMWSPVLTIGALIYLLIICSYEIGKTILQVGWLLIKVICICIFYIILFAVNRVILFGGKIFRKLQHHKKDDIEFMYQPKLYKCDPEKNTECSKSGCLEYCYCTAHKEYSVDGMPINLKEDLKK